MSHHDRKDSTTRSIPRWIPVDLWLKRYDQQRDPNGHYGTPGKDPQNIVTRRAA